LFLNFGTGGNLLVKISSLKIKRLHLSLFNLATIFCLLTCAALQTAEAQPSVTFAQYQQRQQNNAFSFTNNNGQSGTLSYGTFGTPIFFQYNTQAIPTLDPTLQGLQAATITITGFTNQPALPTGGGGNGVRQNFNSIQIQILRDQPASVGSGNRTNLLTATVTSGFPNFSGDIGEQSGSLVASTPVENVTFTSDFLNFANTTSRNFSLSCSSIQPALAFGTNNILQSFTAACTGTFASSPAPSCCGTTSASVSVSGRVITPSGRGLSNAIVTLTQLDGTVRTARTTAFGYYRFSDLAVGQAVILSVQSKRYSFQPMVWNLTEEVDNLNFFSGSPSK
jgi:hypothetical protein